MWKQLRKSRSRVLLVWSLALLSAFSLPLWSQSLPPSPTDLEATQSWQDKYETLRAGVLATVPQLERDLQTASTALQQSKAEKTTVDEQLRKSQTDLAASETDRAQLQATSDALSTRIADLETQVIALSTQLSTAKNSWQDSEASRKDLNADMDQVQSRLQEETKARIQAQTDTVITGVVSGIAGILLGAAVTALISSHGAH